MLHLFLSKQGTLASAQAIHGSKLNLVRLIFVFTAEPRPRYYAPLAAPVRLPSLFLLPVPLARRLVPFPRLCRPRPLRALRRRHR